MQLTYTLDPKNRFAVLTLRASDTPDAWRSGLLALLATVFGDDYAVLLDARQVEPLSASFNAKFLAWLETHGSEYQRARWAVLAQEGSGYGAARQLALRGGSHGVVMEAFTELEGSLHWLRGYLPSFARAG